MRVHEPVAGRCAGRHRRRRKAYIDDRVGADRLSLLHHAPDRLFTRFSQQLGVTLEFATENVFDARHDVATGMLGAYRITLDHAQVLTNSLARNYFYIAD